MEKNLERIFIQTKQRLLNRPFKDLNTRTHLSRFLLQNGTIVGGHSKVMANNNSLHKCSVQK